MSGVTRAVLLAERDTGPVMAENGPPFDVADYLAYYDIEQYLFEQVHSRFQQNGSIGAFDFFSIVIWKANRAKSKVAERLLGKAQRDEDLDAIVRRLTRSLHDAGNARDRFELLLGNDKKGWGFRLPIGSAILTVLWPEEFTVYDVRVCGQLERRVPGSEFKKLAYRTCSERLWEAYQGYLTAVRKVAPEARTLRDADRYLWACSAADQLREDIEKGFPPNGYQEGLTHDRRNDSTRPSRPVGTVARGNATPMCSTLPGPWAVRRRAVCLGTTCCNSLAP